MARAKKHPQEEVVSWESFLDKNLKFKFSEKQIDIVKGILNDDSKITFIDGPAGSSKSFLAVYCGLKLFFREKHERIYYIRPAVEVGRSLGALPGSLEEKNYQFTAPLRDKLIELLGMEMTKKLVGSNFDLSEYSNIACMPTNYLQGCNFANKYIIVDEAQNATKEELLMILTRLAEGSRLVLVGDGMQSCVKNSGWNYFLNFFNDKISAEYGVNQFRMDEDDIVRSGVVKYILMKYRDEFQRYHMVA